MSFITVSFMPVGEFTAIVMTTPLMVTLLAALFLKERVGPLRVGLRPGADRRASPPARAPRARRRAGRSGPPSNRRAGRRTILSK